MANGCISNATCLGMILIQYRVISDAVQASYNYVITKRVYQNRNDTRGYCVSNCKNANYDYESSKQYISPSGLQCIYNDNTNYQIAPE